MRAISALARATILALVAVLAAAVSGAPVQAAPTPTFSAVLTDDGACGFTLTSSWKNVRITKVYGLWYYDGTYVFTTEAPGTGPNGGTLKGRKAVNHAGPATVSSETHGWSVLVQFYDGPVHTFEMFSNVDTVGCAL